MLGGKRRAPSSSFASDGRRLSSSSGNGHGPATTTTFRKPKPTKFVRAVNCSNLAPGGKTNKLFQPGANIIVQRAPVLSCLTVQSGVLKKFQRPMTKRRAYSKNAEDALKNSSLGVKRRMDGMAKLLARAGKGLTFKLPNATTRDLTDDSSEGSDDQKENDNEQPVEPLLLWHSPHQGGEPKGLPPQMITELQCNEDGVEETVTVVKPAKPDAYSKQNVFVPHVLAKWLRPHQREGVQFMYECVMGLKPFNGNGCILADDMGLGKTLQSVALIYTLLKTGITHDGLPTCRRIIIVCPCSLVKNWDNEFVKWLGPGCVKTLALAESDRKSVEKNIDIFVKTKMFNILIVSYETIRTHIGRLSKHKDCCDLLVCDEAHRLKNSDNQTSKALNSLPVRRRVLLTGTPMQNNLEEFFAMVDFTNPGVLAPSAEDFRRRMLAPILRGREPDASDAQKAKMMQIQMDMSSIVNDFILRRVNTLNAQHLPPKLVQVVCCNLTGIQQNMYQQLVAGKDLKHVLEGKQDNCLGYIQMLMKLCNHPSLIVEEEATPKSGRRAATKTVKYSEEEAKVTIEGAQGLAKFLPYTNKNGSNSPVFPEWSGKMFVLYRLMKEMRKPGNGNDKIVIISNYTQTLDLIGKMCRENSWGFCRLDGGVTMKKRQKMVDEFNDPQSSLVAFLLSSKAGGCGINLIGGNRLVLFDPDWNPAVDAQAAARCWRDGQKKRCFTYRFLATGTVEEKIFQRQLAKQGLQQVVDDKEQVNALSTKDLRNLFKLRQDTPSDTHDKLRCERCQTISDNAEVEAKKVLPKKLAACGDLLDRMLQQNDSSFFAKPLVAQDHGVSKDLYEKKVKQPIDLGTIRSRLELPHDKPGAYASVTGFSKDVNRVFANVLKVWTPGQEIADAARRLQAWWVDEWTNTVPILMFMKSDNESGSPQFKAELELDLDSSNNERGDNFQEQIGMPDEEDMRCWSHHHSVDTVDDPIFRAAMRGSDSVSFVFGLEVTWSLIQQRKQEEEEKLALLELEEAQRCSVANTSGAYDCSSDESDDEMVVESLENTANRACDGDSPRIPVSHTNQCIGLSEVVESNNDINDDSEGDIAMANNFEPKVADESPDVCLKVSTNPPLTPINFGAQQGKNGEIDPADVHDTTPGTISCPEELTSTKSEHPAGLSANECELPMDKWKCMSCTFLSSATRTTCEMCRTRRDLSATEKWLCETCTYVNASIKKSCGMCKKKRQPPKKKRRILGEVA